MNFNVLERGKKKREEKEKKKKEKTCGVIPMGRPCPRVTFLRLIFPYVLSNKHGKK